MASRSQSRASRAAAPRRGQRAAGPDRLGGRLSPPVPTSVGRPRSASSTTPDATAVTLFERAIGAVQQHNYRAAAALFRELLASFPAEHMLLERARVYLDLCERESQGHQTPLTAEERLTAATAALNNEHDEEAERLAHSVLDELPDQDLALYLLAAVHARRGDAETAIAWLARATAVSPDVRAQARHDADFQPLRQLEAFQQLLESPISARSGAPHNRRVR